MSDASEDTSKKTLVEKVCEQKLVENMRLAYGKERCRKFAHMLSGLSVEERDIVWDLVEKLDRNAPHFGGSTQDPPGCRKCGPECRCGDDCECEDEGRSASSAIPLARGGGDYPLAGWQIRQHWWEHPTGARVWLEFVKEAGVNVQRWKAARAGAGEKHLGPFKDVREAIDHALHLKG